MSARPPFFHSSTSYADHHSPAGQVTMHTMNSQSSLAGQSSKSTFSTSSSSSSNGSGSNPSVPVYHLDATAPYTDYDYPPEKSELDSTPDYPHSSRTYEPFRFDRRSVPLETQQSLSRRGSWKDRLTNKEECKGGRLGKALIIGWVVTTVMFVIATAFYKGELFTGES
jgi:hypothetical protein